MFVITVVESDNILTFKFCN